MLEFILHLIPSVVRLMVFISLGVFVGCLLEHSGLSRKLAVLSRPFERWSRLPRVCASAFALAFISPRAANGMLAGACLDERITRREMISAAIANTFPNTFLHLRTMAFAIIPLLGTAGLAYVLFQLISGLCCTLFVITVLRYTLPRKPHTNATQTTLPETTKLSGKEVLHKACKRTQKILKRILVLTVPLYLIIGLLDHYGLFTKLATQMPATLANILSPASMTVIAAHMSSMLNAASVASKLLESGTLTHLDVFIALLFGYTLSVPIRVIRHSIPSALGVFPGRDGLRIVFIAQGLRLLLALLTLTALLIWRLS